MHEYIPRTAFTAASRRVRPAPPPPDEARLIFYETLLITAFEHECAWVHRDRKPDNMLVSFRDPVLSSHGHDFKKGFRDQFRFTAESMKSLVVKDCDLGLARTIPFEPSPVVRPGGGR